MTRRATARGERAHLARRRARRRPDLRRVLRRPGRGARAGRLGRGRAAGRPLRGRRARHLGLRRADAVAARHGRRGLDPPGDPVHGVPHAARHRCATACPGAGRRSTTASCAELLFAQTDARFETAKVNGRSDDVVHTDRGDLRAPLIVDALGWRRVLAREGYQPPDAPLSRGLEVHPHGGGEDLDVWVDRSLVRCGYGWRVPAGARRASAWAPTSRATTSGTPTEELADAARARRRPLAGQLVPAPPAARRRGRRVLRRRQRRALLPALGRGDPHGVLLRDRRGARDARGARAASAPARRRWRVTAAFSASHARAFGLALRLQRLIPALPPRVLTLGLRALGRQRLVDRAFGWYLDQAHPDFALAQRRPRRAERLAA